MQIMAMSIKNIMRRKSGSFITFLSIFIGIFSIVIINKISTGAKLEIDKQLSSMGADCINIKSTSDKGTLKTMLHESDIARIKKESDAVKMITPLIFNYGAAEVTSNTGSSDSGTKTAQGAQTVVIGVDINAVDIFSAKFTSGKMFSTNDVKKGEKVCVVDSAVLTSLPLTRSRTIKLSLNGKENIFRIVGSIDYKSQLVNNIMGEGSPLFIFIPYTAMQNITGTSGFDRISIKYDNTVDPVPENTRIAEYLNKTLATKSFSSETLDSQMSAVDDMIDMFSLVLSLIGVISLVIAGFSMISLMLANVTERTREIGIKKALGAKNSHILFEFLFESVIISFAGGISGSVIGSYLYDYTARRINISYAPGGGLILISTLGAVLLGIIFGAMPSIKAARLEPIRALSGGA